MTGKNKIGLPRSLAGRSLLPVHDSHALLNPCHRFAIMGKFLMFIFYSVKE